MAFDVNGARQAGYSDAEILSFLNPKFDVKGARESGYSDKEILAHVTGEDNKPSGAADGLFHGLAEEAKGIGSSLKTFAGIDTPNLDAAAKVAEPDNYKGASILPEGAHWYDPRTYNLGAIPQVAGEMVPGMATDILAAKAASKIPVIGKYAGPAAGVASYLLRTRGQAAQNDAAIRTGNPDAQPETQDKVRSLVTGAAESIPQALGIGRFLPGSSKTEQTASQTLAKLGITAATEGGAGAASNAISQAGATIGTPGGLKVDPNQVAESGIAGAVAGGGLAIPGAVGEIHGARKYAQYGGDNQKATEAVVQRVNDAADGASLKNVKTAYNAMRTADEGVRDELKAAVKPLKDTLDEDTLSALKRVGKGRTLTDSDLATIEANTSPDVAFLARQAHVAQLMKGEGDYGRGKFVGGAANAVENHIRALQNPVGAGVSAGLGAAGLGGHAASLFAYGPATIAAIGGGYGALRALDRITGARSPMAAIAERFQTPDAPTRLPAPAEAPPPAGPTAGPTGPNVPFNPSVANGNALLATGGSPWAPKPTPEPQAPIDPLALPSELVKKSKTITDALRRVQAMREANTPPAPTPPPTINPLALPKDITGPSKNIIGGIQNAQEMQAAANPPPPPAPEAPPAINPLALPKGIVGPAKTLTSALQKVAEMRQAAEAKSQVDRIAQDSPLVNDAGGLGAIENPKVGKTASGYVSAANALKKLMAQPEEEAPAAPSGIPGESVPASMADILKNLGNATKAKAKITKKKGEEQPKVETPPAPEPAAETPYEPIPEDQLWRKGMNDAAVAEQELSKYEPSVRKKYAKNVVKNRALKRDTLEGLATNDSTDANDSRMMGSLYHQLDHISRRAQARRAIEFFTAKMTPAGAQQVKDTLAPLMEKLWSKE